MTTNSRIAKCLCGKVELSMPSTSNNVDACHCSMCLRWGGGPFLSLDGCKDITINGEEFVSVYQSSQWAERAFCSACGSHLYYRLTASGEYMVPPGLLNSGNGLKMNTEIFIDEKPGYYALANSSKQLTSAEVMEMFGSVTKGD